MVKNTTFNYFQILKIMMNTKKYNNKSFPKKVTNGVENDKIKELYDTIQLPEQKESGNTGGTLPTPSDEQNEIILNFKAGYNLKIEAVAGAGKTTTLLLLSKIAYNNFGAKSLILTYNKGLQLEIQNTIDGCGLTGSCLVYTIHGYASKVYRKCINNDKILRQCLNDLEPLYNPQIPVLFIDEVQDMNEDYHKFITKLTYQEQILVLTGDRRQNIGEYKGADEKYLVNYDQYFNTGRLWKELTLRTSYRLTPAVANFVNKNILNEELIIPGNFKHDDIKPLYYYSEWNFANDNILQTMVKKFGADEVVIMKASVSNISLNKTSKGSSCPLGKLVSNSKDIKFCVREEESLTEKEMKGKVLLSSFNSMKGKQRLCTIVYGVNESYFKYYEKGWSDDKKSLPNILYVACTRAQACLILVQDDKNQHLRTTNVDIIISTCNVIGCKDEKIELNNNKKKKDNYSVTEVIKHRTTTDIIKLLEFIKITEISPSSQPLKYENIIQFEGHYEDIRTYYGILIPIIAEYRTRGDIRFECMPIPDESNEMIEPLHIVNRFNQLVLNKSKTYNEWMELIVLNNSMETSHYFMIKQITNYDWVDVNFIEESVNRLLNTIENDGSYEVSTSIKKFNIDKTKYDKYNLNGSIDYLTNNNIWEFKNALNLSDEYKIQTAIYISLYYLQNRILLPGKLFNFRTLELLEITVENPELFVDTLMKKYL